MLAEVPWIGEVNKQPSSNDQQSAAEHWICIFRFGERYEGSLNWLGISEETGSSLLGLLHGYDHWKGGERGSRDEREAQDIEKVEVERAMKGSKNVTPKALGLYPFVYRWRIRLLT